MIAVVGHVALPTMPAAPVVPVMPATPVTVPPAAPVTPEPPAAPVPPTRGARAAGATHTGVLAVADGSLASQRADGQRQGERQVLEMEGEPPAASENLLGRDERGR